MKIGRRDEDMLYSEGKIGEKDGCCQDRDSAKVDSHTTSGTSKSIYLI